MKPSLCLATAPAATAARHPITLIDRGAGQRRGAVSRLWIATLRLPAPLDAYLAAPWLPDPLQLRAPEWPASYYQTVYATEMGSAEMPSAGRAFTPELLMRLVARGIVIAPLLLHTGVASVEDHEPPYEEYYRVPLETARLSTRRAPRASASWRSAPRSYARWKPWPIRRRQSPRRGLDAPGHHTARGAAQRRRPADGPARAALHASGDARSPGRPRPPRHHLRRGAAPGLSVA